MKALLLLLVAALAVCALAKVQDILHIDDDVPEDLASKLISLDTDWNVELDAITRNCGFGPLSWSGGAQRTLNPANVAACRQLFFNLLNEASVPTIKQTDIQIQWNPVTLSDSIISNITAVGPDAIADAYTIFMTTGRIYGQDQKNTNYQVRRIAHNKIRVINGGNGFVVIPKSPCSSTYIPLPGRALPFLNNTNPNPCELAYTLEGRRSHFIGEKAHDYVRVGNKWKIYGIWNNGHSTVLDNNPVLFFGYKQINDVFPLQKRAVEEGRIHFTTYKLAEQKMNL